MITQVQVTLGQLGLFAGRDGWDNEFECFEQFLSCAILDKLSTLADSMGEDDNLLIMDYYVAGHMPSSLTFEVEYDIWLR